MNITAIRHIPVMFYANTPFWQTLRKVLLFFLLLVGVPFCLFWWAFLAWVFVTGIYFLSRLF